MHRKITVKQTQSVVALKQGDRLNGPELMLSTISLLLSLCPSPSHTHIRAHTRARARTHTHTHTHTYARAHTHTHAQSYPMTYLPLTHTLIMYILRVAFKTAALKYKTITDDKTKKQQLHMHSLGNCIYCNREVIKNKINSLLYKAANRRDINKILYVRLSVFTFLLVTSWPWAAVNVSKPALVKRGHWPVVKISKTGTAYSVTLRWGQG